MCRKPADIVTIFLILFLPFAAKGQPHVAVSPGFMDTLLCKGGSFTLPYEVDTEMYFRDTNLFKVHLSDANGNFSNPVIIGIAGGIDDGAINCTIPSTIAAGTGYRVRIVSTSPIETSADNGRNLRISPYPTAMASNNTPICPSGILHMSGVSDAGTSGIYKWTGPNSYISTLQNPSYNQPPVGASGIYTMAVTMHGCTSYDTTKVIIVDPPDPWIRPSGTQYICAGTALTLDAQDTSLTPGLSFNWKGPKGFFVNYSVFQRYNADTSFAGTYVIELKVGNCAKQDSVQVHILPRPDTALAGSNSPVCVGDTIRLNALTASSNVSYAWRGPNGFSSNQQNPIITNFTNTAAGEYIVTATYTSNGCKSLETKTKVVVGTPLPKPSINGKTDLCYGDQLQLIAIGGSSGVFTWTLPAGNTSTVKALSLVAVNKADAGVYTVIQSYNGCISPPAQTTVYVTEVPVPAASTNAPICDQEELKLDALQIDSATYEWKGPDGFYATGRNPTVPNAGLAKTGTYHVTAKVGECKSTASIDAVVNPIPKITSVIANSPVCEQDTLTLSATTDLDSCSFWWQGPNGFSSALATPRLLAVESIEGTYTAIATAKNCASQPGETNIIVNPLPALPTIKTNSPISEGETLELGAECPTPDVSFEWHGVGGFTAVGPTIAIPDMTVENEGHYYVWAITKDGCRTSAFSSVTVGYNARSLFGLSPNPGDGLITFKGLVQTKNYLSIQVYNITGQPLHYQKLLPVNKKFNINIDLRHLPAGVYFLHVRTEKESESIRFVIE